VQDEFGAVAAGPAASRFVGELLGAMRGNDPAALLLHDPDAVVVRDVDVAGLARTRRPRRCRRSGLGFRRRPCLRGLRATSHFLCRDLAVRGDILPGLLGLLLRLLYGVRRVFLQGGGGLLRARREVTLEPLPRLSRSALQCAEDVEPGPATSGVTMQLDKSAIVQLLEITGGV
jgi:hypothetical protein